MGRVEAKSFGEKDGRKNNRIGTEENRLKSSNWFIIYVDSQVFLLNHCQFYLRFNSQ